MPYKDSSLILKVLVLPEGPSYTGEINISGRLNHITNPKSSFQFSRKLYRLQDGSRYSPTIPFNLTEGDLELLIKEANWGSQSNYHDSPKPDFDIDTNILDYFDTLIISFWSEIFDVSKLKPVQLHSLRQYTTSPLFFRKAKEVIRREERCLTINYRLRLTGEQINQGLGFRSQEEIEEDEKLVRQKVDAGNPMNPAQEKTKGHDLWTYHDAVNRGSNR